MAADHLCLAGSDDPLPPQTQLLVGLYIIYLKQYDTYHDTHEAIFDMYQQYILSGLRQKKLIYPQISLEFGNFNDQNTLNLSKNVLFEVSYN